MPSKRVLQKELSELKLLLNREKLKTWALLCAYVGTRGILRAEYNLSLTGNFDFSFLDGVKYEHDTIVDYMLRDKLIFIKDLNFHENGDWDFDPFDP